MNTLPISSPEIESAACLGTAWRHASLWAGLHWLLGALFILAFSTRYQWGGWKYRVLFVGFHWAVCGVGWLGLLFVSGWLLRFSRSRWWRRGICLGLSLGFVLMLALWLADWVTMQQWGGNLSDQLSWEVVRHWPDYVRLLPAKIYVGLALAFTLVGGLYWQGTAWALPSFVVLAQQLRRQLGAARGGLLLLSYAVLFAALWHPWMLRWNYWQREPVVSFLLLARAHWLFPGQAQAYLPATPRRLQQAARDQQLRQTYPRGLAPKRNVILITVDSWRADHLPLYGYARQTTPFLSRLAKENRLQKVVEAHATCNATYCAVLSVLASRNVPDLGAGVLQLQDVLKDQGYQVHFLLSGVHTAWYNLRQLYGQSIDTFFDGTLARDYVANDDRAVIARLQELPASQGQPTFFYVHLMSPHMLGTRLPEYAEWQPVSSKLRVYNSPEVNANTYDHGVRMADAMIEQIFATLEAKGYLRDSFAVILGDHGEALGEHQHYSHGLGLYEEDLRIPLLLVETPNAAPVAYPPDFDYPSAVQLDVAPTILARLGLPTPASWQGQALVLTDTRTHTFHEAGFHPQQALLYREGPYLWKYIRHRTTQAEELYELHTDRREEHNLIAQPVATTFLPQLRTMLDKQ